MAQTPEQIARTNIDEQLARCGWKVQPYSAIDFSAGPGIAITEVPLKGGSCDYLLLVDRKAVGIIEAKREGLTLSSVAEQSAFYAKNIPDLLSTGVKGTLPFLYESTGIETFFRDERDPNPRPRPIYTFHRPETLAEWAVEPNTLRSTPPTCELARWKL